VLATTPPIGIRSTDEPNPDVVESETSNGAGGVTVMGLPARLEPATEKVLLTDGVPTVVENALTVPDTLIVGCKIVALIIAELPD